MDSVIPDELRIKIIKESIEPFDLHVQKSPTGNQLTYDGLPKILNILLVSKMFHDEAMTVIKEKFTGNLAVDLDCVVSLVATDIFNKLRHKVRIVSVRRYQRDEVYHLESMNLKILLAYECTPTLQKLILTNGGSYDTMFDGILEKIVHISGCAWRKLIAQVNRRHLDEAVELLNLIQTRKLSCTINEFYVLASSLSDKVGVVATNAQSLPYDIGVLVTHGRPSEDGEYTFAVGESYLSKFADFYDFARSYETNW